MEGSQATIVSLGGRSAATLAATRFPSPARGGSSIGTSRAAGEEALIEAIEAAREYDSKVIVELAMEGAEIECSVLEGLDGGPPDTSLPGQLVIIQGSGHSTQSSNAPTARATVTAFLTQP